jgi:SAM-dependent MidA family methyltransferase
VTEVIINQDKTTSIKLDSDNMFGAIICNFNTEEIKNIEEHESITIKGSCSGFLMDVILEKCTIVEV